MTASTSSVQTAMLETNLAQRLTGPWIAKDEPLPPPPTERVYRPGMLSGTPEWKAAGVVLRRYLRWDYMGAAEYEFGTIPGALEALVADSERLVTFQMVLCAKQIPRNFARERKAYTKAGKLAKKQPVHPPMVDREVYVLCRPEHVEEIKRRIPLLAKHEIRVKMGTRLDLALDPIEDFDKEVQGWLELNNGFFFFVDKGMWSALTMLFTGKDAIG